MKAAPSIRPAAAGPAFRVPSRPVVRVDPRITARRIAVRRDEGRRRLHRLLWIGGAIAVVVTALGSTRTPLLDVDRIDVRGAGRLGADGVREAVAAAGLVRGQALVDVDRADAEAALESLPSVAEASVGRRWPGTVVIEVTEREPVATVAVSAGQALIGADGVVIAIEPPGAVVGLVPVEGAADLEPGDRFDEAALLAVAGALPESLVGRVASIGPGDGALAVDLHLVDGGVVHLGAADQLAAKLVAAETVLAQVDGSCLTVIDVRVPSAPTVRRDPRCG